MIKDDLVDTWLDDCVDELRAMGKKYDLSFETQLVGNRPFVQWTNDKVGVATFGMTLRDTIDDDEILGFDYRRDMFLKELSRWIAKYSDSPAEGIYKVLFSRMPKDSSQNVHRFEFKIATPDWLVNEALQQEEDELYQKLHRMVAHWIAASIDFELQAKIDCGHVKRGVKDTWKEKCYVHIDVHDDDGDNLIEVEKRAEFFLQKAIIPDLEKLYNEGVSISYVDPRLIPSSRYIGYGDLFKTIRSSMQDVMKKNKERGPSDFRSNVMLQLETRREMR